MVSNFFYQTRKIPSSSTISNLDNYSIENKVCSSLGELKHNNALETIVSNPSVIGFSEGVCVDREIPFYGDNNQQLGEVDLIIRDYFQDTQYYVEYKCHDTDKNRKKAKRQLKKAKRYLKSLEKSSRLRLLYIYDNFNVEELIEDNFEPYICPDE